MALNSYSNRDLSHSIENLDQKVDQVLQWQKNYDKHKNTNYGKDGIERSQDFSQDENEERGNWTGRLDFLLSCLGYAVGLGNVWRFPYLCFQNGGGAFLIPYVIMLLFVGLPIFFLELSLGQFSSSGPLTCWKFAPMFTGIGIGMTIVSGLVAIYYNMIIAWSLFYLFASFTSYLPWNDCNSWWASDMCRQKIPDTFCNETVAMAITSGVCKSCPDAVYNMVETCEDCLTPLLATAAATATNCFKGCTDILKTTPPPANLTAVLTGICANCTDFIDSVVSAVDPASSTNCQSCVNPIYKIVNGSCVARDSGNTIIGMVNETQAMEYGVKRHLPSEDYYTNFVLSLSDGIGNLGPVKWQLCLCLLLAWVIVFLCLCKGVKSSGKVVYFTALFPYVVLVILLIRGVLLDGHMEGIMFYLTPKWDLLKRAKVWNDAAIQIFFSLSACWGGLITLASYNRFHNNHLRDALIVSLGNCLTSFFAGFVIFSFIGYQAKVLNLPVEKVADSGAGLAFVVYADAVTRLPISPLWAILFFVMLITLGLDSQFTLMETVITALLDLYPKLLRPKKIWVILSVCIAFFLLGLTLCTHGGVYMLTLMDSYAGGWAVLLIGFFECTSLTWIYGWNRLSADIECMLGSKPSVWWRICWQFLSPSIILFVLLFAWIDYQGTKYGDYAFPMWANILGWLTSLFVVIFIPIFAIYILIVTRGNFVQRVKTVCTPSREWGPALPKHRRLVARYIPNLLIDPSKPTDQFTDISDKGADNPAYIDNERL